MLARQFAGRPAAERLHVLVALSGERVEQRAGPRHLPGGLDGWRVVAASDKNRLIEFGRFAAQRRAARGLGSARPLRRQRDRAPDGRIRLRMNRMISGNRRASRFVVGV